MVNVEDCILGNSELRDRFFAMTEILARLVSSAPRGVSIAHLEDATGRSEKELTKFCTALERDGLLRRDPKVAGKWTLTCDPSLVTLEDVFRCVMAEQQSRSRSAAKSVVADRAPSDVDLLVMQAMIAINQSVFKHLRQFSLDRLKISAAGVFPSSRPPLGDSRLDDDFELAISGREASFSPAQLPA